MIGAIFRFLMKIAMRIALYRSLYHTLKRIYIDIRTRLSNRRANVSSS
jgi:hypothetical protein